MIVNQIQSGWEIVYHPAHGLLAAQIAWQLRPEMFVANYRPQTVAAIESHDDHQIDFEAFNYVTEVGAPRDFTLIEHTAESLFQQVKRVTDEAYRKSCWTGLLVSNHCCFLYEKEQVAKKLRKLLDDLVGKRDSLLEHTEFTAKHLETSYDLLRFCDRTSLILTRRNLPEMQRAVEIITFADGTTYSLRQREDTSLSVDPWPFASEEFTVRVDTTRLDQLEFADDKALQAAIEAAEIIERRWTFRQTD